MSSPLKPKPQVAAKGPSLEGKIALVTGANRGIGFEVARQLAVMKGYTVFVGARDPIKGAEAVEKISLAEGMAQLLPLDVENPSSVAQAAAFLERTIPHLDVLVNNAAILLDDEIRGLIDTPAELVEATMKTNVLGVIRVVQDFLPLLKKAKNSRIVNVSSGAGSLTSSSAYAPAYSISKTALNAVTKHFSINLAGRVAVNSVCPGWVKTDMGGEGAPRTVKEGADGIVWLAVDAPHDQTGKFFRDRKEIPW